MRENASAPLFSEGDDLESNAFLDTFFRDPVCSAYGWGPILSYPAYTEISKQDTPSEAVHFIHKGLVKLTWIDQAGHEVIAGLRHQKWIIGAPAVLLNKPYSFTVTTLTRCELRCISRNDFLKLMKTNTEFAFQVSKVLCQEIYKHARKLIMFGCIPARERLKYLLHKFITDAVQSAELQKEVKIKLPLSQREIAQIVAVTPEHLSRLLKDLERQRLIKREKDGLVLLDTTKLRRRNIY